MNLTTVQTDRDRVLSQSISSLSIGGCGLLTDLYQLTMTACYVGESIERSAASFELFVRKLPKGFGYLIAMGLAQALEYLESLQFSSTHIAALQATGVFKNAPDRFWELLATAKFTGDVWAVPEGTAVFANEPILRIEAPLWQAQLVETYLLNTINYQTLIATRAARIRDVAGADATLLEFGTRRAFSPQASIWAARAAIAGGLDTTSNVLAALKLGYQPSGTMAHSLVMAIGALEGSEQAAFTAFDRYFPGAPLLIDTYDPIAAATGLATRVAAGEIELSGIRLDSGDLIALSKQVNSILPNVEIFASGDLDEWEIAKLRSANAPISGYGLGTKLVTGSPVNGVYKLVEIENLPTMKKSPEKMTYPGRKQIFRQVRDGQFTEDILGLANEGTGLLQLVMSEGERLKSDDSLPAIREHTDANVASLSREIRDINYTGTAPVNISPALAEITQSLMTPS
ncbi:nicotinate phosphoribosyltransferase [Chamaesiphon polymorphus]|nr:nicotinate phosphoribosyltransferase [Chamaesiphon polymorphus]